jgi:hypothetical protein
LRRLIRKRDRWYRRKKKSGNQGDAKKYKTLKQETQRKLRKAYWSYFEDIVTPKMHKQEDTIRNSMKRFWTFIKHKKSDGNTIPPLKSNGVLHSQSEEKANILIKKFQKAFSEKTEITDQEFRTRCEMQGNFPTMSDIVFTENGITKLLANLNPHKAAGPDNIKPRVLKELAMEISPILTLIFNKSYVRRSSIYMAYSTCMSNIQKGEEI